MPGDSASGPSRDIFRKVSPGMPDMTSYESTGSCPFIGREYEMCFISRLTSQAIPNILKYCAGDYENCDVYKELTAGADS